MAVVGLYTQNGRTRWTYNLTESVVIAEPVVKIYTMWRDLCLDSLTALFDQNQDKTNMPPSSFSPHEQGTRTGKTNLLQGPGFKRTCHRTSFYSQHSSERLPRLCGPRTKVTKGGFEAAALCSVAFLKVNP
mmetsp:Transcript_40159/g.94401  ORF Transcript_40159/g.94401 Transcript_40159/m.94401 type:complete len:131 (+) Transcript_40159:701-1093(+)